MKQLIRFKVEANKWVNRSFEMKLPNWTWYKFVRDEILIVLHTIIPKLYHKIPVPEMYQKLEFVQANLYFKTYYSNEPDKLNVIKITNRSLKQIGVQSVVYDGEIVTTPWSEIFEVSDLLFYCHELQPQNIMSQEELTELILKL